MTYAILVQRSYQLSYQANWELIKLSKVRKFSKTFPVQELHMQKYLEYQVTISWSEIKMKTWQKKVREKLTPKRSTLITAERCFFRDGEKAKTISFESLSEKVPIGNRENEEKREASIHFSLFSQSPASQSNHWATCKKG